MFEAFKCVELGLGAPLCASLSKYPFITGAIMILAVIFLLLVLIYYVKRRTTANEDGDVELQASNGSTLGMSSEAVEDANEEVTITTARVLRGEEVLYEFPIDLDTNNIELNDGILSWVNEKGKQVLMMIGAEDIIMAERPSSEG
jgi:hypothetical protein